MNKKQIISELYANNDLFYQYLDGKISIGKIIELLAEKIEQLYIEK